MPLRDGAGHRPGCGASRRWRVLLPEEGKSTLGGRVPPEGKDWCPLGGVILANAAIYPGRILQACLCAGAAVTAIPDRQSFVGGGHEPRDETTRGTGQKPVRADCILT